MVSTVAWVALFAAFMVAVLTALFVAGFAFGQMAYFRSLGDRQARRRAVIRLVAAVAVLGVLTLAADRFPAPPWAHGSKSTHQNRS